MITTRIFSKPHTRSLGVHQRGIMLLEVLAGLIIFAAVITGVTMMINKNSEDTQAAIAAQHLRTIGDAAAAYIRSNYVAVQANVSDTQLALITVTDLTAANNLPAGFPSSNSYHQQVCVLVKKDPARAGQLIALAVAEGGTEMNDVIVNTVANLVGASGGAIRTTNSGTIIGSRNSWSIATNDFNLNNHVGRNCSGGAGQVALNGGRPVMALWLANGGINPDVIYRTAIPGRPDLNKMETPLDLAQRTEGEACLDSNETAITHGFARNSGGDLLTCKDGKWVRATAGGNAVLRKSGTPAEKGDTGKTKYFYANCDTDSGEKLIMGSCSAYCHQFVPIGGSPHYELVNGKSVAKGWKCAQSSNCLYENAKVACTRTSEDPRSGNGKKDGFGILISTDENDIKECTVDDKGPNPCNICPPPDAAGGSGDACTLCSYGSSDGKTCDEKCTYKTSGGIKRVREDCKICNNSSCVYCKEDERKSVCEDRLVTPPEGL